MDLNVGIPVDGESNHVDAVEPAGSHQAPLDRLDLRRARVEQLPLLQRNELADDTALGALIPLDLNRFEKVTHLGWRARLSACAGIAVFVLDRLVGRVDDRIARSVRLGLGILGGVDRGRRDYGHGVLLGGSHLRRTPNAERRHECGPTRPKSHGASLL